MLIMMSMYIKTKQRWWQLMFSSAVKYIIITAALIIASIVIEGFTPGGGGIWRVHTRGGWDAQWGPPFCSLRGGGSHQGKVGFTPLYPGVNPTPHWLPVPHWGELKFPRVINPDSPLNDSRQLECPSHSPPQTNIMNQVMQPLTTHPAKYASKGLNTKRLFIDKEKTEELCLQTVICLRLFSKEVKTAS